MTKNATKSLSRKAQGEETRQVLVETGARLFGQNGYHGVSMRTLAAEAGVNLATVGYHFGGKAGLYEAIMDEIIEVRDSFFPPQALVEEHLAEAGDDPRALGEVVTWYVNSLVNGMLGREEYVWPAFLISRELAQPSEMFSKLEHKFFDPSLESLKTLVRGTVSKGTDEEDIIITSQCIIGMVVKFLEGRSMMIKRLNWESYGEYGLNKLASVIGKRTRGLLGLPMENV